MKIAKKILSDFLSASVFLLFVLLFSDVYSFFLRCFIKTALLFCRKFFLEKSQKRLTDLKKYAIIRVSQGTTQQ
jgi:hypothetical protein